MGTISKSGWMRWSYGKFVYPAVFLFLTAAMFLTPSMPVKAAVQPPAVPGIGEMLAPTPPTGYVWDDNRTIYPTGDGYTNGDWNAVGASTKFECVDEPSPNDSDYFRGDGDSSESDYQLFIFDSFNQPVFREAAVTVYFRARDNLWAALDDNNIQAALQINGERYHAGSHNPPQATISGTGDFADYSYSWTTNPATGLAWTATDIAAIEQFGVYSNDLQPSIRVSALRMEVDYVRRYPFVSFSFATPHMSETYAGEMGMGVNLSNPTDETIIVGYSATPGTATPGVDYNFTPGSVTFAPGETSGLMRGIFHLNDYIHEGPETIILSLSNPSPAGYAFLGSPATATWTIDDDDPDNYFEVMSERVTEGDTTHTMTISVGLFWASTSTATVHYATANGTALGGGPTPDYAPVSGDLTFAPGETVKTVNITIYGDNIYEPSNEYFFFRLSNPKGASFNYLTGNEGVLIEDDDATKKPVINEFVADHVGDDTNEYIEILGYPSTNYSDYRLLCIENDSGQNPGVIDKIITSGITDASGYWTTGYLNNQLEDGNFVLLLVYGFTGSLGQDLDTNNDGGLEVKPWDQSLREVDAVAVYRTDPGDIYFPYTPLIGAGGGSRIPNGTGSWLANDFDGYGLPGFTGTPKYGECQNTPGAANIMLTTPHTVTFDLGTHGTRTGGGALVQSVSHNGSATAPTVAANTGWIFNGWDATFTNVTSDLAVHALYTEITYALTVNVSGSGSVTKEPVTGPYPSGSTVQLTAVPSAGYHFVDWSGDLTGTENPKSITMTGNKTVTANFAVNTYNLTVICNPAAGGTVSSTGGTYEPGTFISLRPTASTGWRFNGWSGDVVIMFSMSDPVTFTMPARNVTLYASFIQNDYVVYTAVTGNGSVVPNMVVKHYGDPVSLAATPGTGYHLVDWTGDYTGTEPSLSFNMPASDVHVTANFALDTYTVSFDSTGGSAVASQTLPVGSLVSRPANPARSGCAFGGWYKDTAYTDEWNFSADILSADIILYARWAALDQGISPTGNSVPAWNDTFAQTFTAGRTGGLYMVSCYLSNGSAFSLTVEIQGVTDSIPNGNVLATSTVYVPASPTTQRWVDATFVNPYPVTTGQQYAIVWKGLTAGTNIHFYYSTTDAYPGGQALVLYGSSWLSGTGPDFVFRTFILSHPGISLTPTSGLVTTEYGGTATFSVQLDSEPTADVTIDISSDDTSEGMISPVSLTFTPANWNTPQVVTVTGVDDSVADGDVAYQILTAATVSSDPAYNGLNPANVNVTNNDNDTAALAISGGITVTETTPPPQVTLTVTLSVPSTQTVTVDYATADGTAAAGSDYVANSGTLNFAAGDLEKTFTVDIIGDDVFEADENFYVRLSSPVNASIATGEVMITIANDDARPTYSLTVNITGSGSVSRNPATGPYEEGSSVQLTAVPATGYHFVSWSGDLTGTESPETISMSADKTVTANFAIDTFTVNFDLGTHGTRTGGGALTQTVNYGAAATAPTFSVETYWSFTGWDVAFSSITANLNVHAHYVSTLPSVYFLDHSMGVTEGSDVGIPVFLSSSSALPVTVHYTVSGTATYGTDYTITGYDPGTGGTITIPAGSTYVHLRYQITADGLDENAETIIVTLSSPTNANLGTYSAFTFNVSDGDEPPSISIADSSVVEGNDGSTNMVFNWELSTPSGLNITVHFDTAAGGTATAGTDYAAASSTITIPAGQRTGTATVTVYGDAIEENDEIFTVNLTSPVNVTIGDGTATGTIRNDDTSVYFLNHSMDVNEGREVGIPVLLSSTSALPVTVHYTVSGTATYGTDYTITGYDFGTGGTITIPAGGFYFHLWYQIFEDYLVETGETIIVTLSSPTNANLGTYPAFTFNVSDVNRAPTGIGIDNSDVDENMASGTTVGTFSTTDPDAGGSFTYTLVAGTGDTDNASFTIDGGTLKTAASFNYEAKSSYSIRVQTKDAGNLTFEKVFTITVNDVNESPVITSGAAVSMNENTTAVATVTATDPDSDTLTYSISGGADQALFSINGSSGVLSFVSSPDYESPADSGANNVYNVQVTVADNGTGNLTDVQDIAITVNNVNEAPTGIGIDNSDVDENMASGTTVGTFSTTDPDAGGSFTYTLVAGTGDTDNASFTIDGGTLKTAASFNYEAKSSYSIRVQTKDAGNLTFEKVFTITVNDVNESPVITEGDSTSVTMSEDGNPTAFSLTLHSTDDDGDTLTWSIFSSASHGTASASGTGSSKVISYAPADDYNGSDSFEVRVSDGVLTDIITVNVTIEAVNDAPTGEATPETQTVDYSDPISEVTFTANDIDSAGSGLSISFTHIFNAVMESINGLPDGLECSIPDVITEGPLAEVAWTISGGMNVKAGTYVVTARITDAEGGWYDESFTVVVDKENSTIKFDSANDVAVRVASDGGSSSAFTWQVIISQADDGNPGELSLIQASDISLSFSAVGAGGNWSGTAWSFDPETCIAIFNVPENALGVETYTGTVTLDNEWFKATPVEDVLVVYDPSLGFTTGGGWFTWPSTGTANPELAGARVNFGYTMKYTINKKNVQVKGSLLLIAHLPDGSIVRIKSNALEGLAITSNTYPGIASFSGKCVYSRVDTDGNVVVESGNQEFTVYVKDMDEPGEGTDLFWFTTHLTIAGESFSLDSNGNNKAEDLEFAPIRGGNLVVPHTSAGGTSDSSEAPVPTIDSIDIASGSPEDTLTITITGTGFTDATKVSFGAGITVTGFTVKDDNTIEVEISISSRAKTGPRNITVTTPSGTATLDKGFTVN